MREGSSLREKTGSLEILREVLARSSDAPTMLPGYEGHMAGGHMAGHGGHYISPRHYTGLNEDDVRSILNQQYTGSGAPKEAGTNDSADGIKSPSSSSSSSSSASLSASASASEPASGRSLEGAPLRGKSGKRTF